MKPKLKPGKYLLAVSGGVDSMSLLDMLSNLSGMKLVVAHFDHRMRPGSDKDAKFVALAAERYHLPFVGASATKIPKNEAEAREARYKFLTAKAAGRGAKVVTAHHQDDLIETAFINLLRGTGRRGLSAIADNPDIIRPLLNVPKTKILEYAKGHNLRWREDPTNQQTDYLRNYVRHKLIPKLKPDQRRALLTDIGNLSALNHILDKELESLLRNVAVDGQLDRQRFIALPPEVAREALTVFLRRAGLKDFDSKDIERLVVAVKTAKAGTKHDILQGWYLAVERRIAHLSNSGH